MSTSIQKHHLNDSNSDPAKITEHFTLVPAINANRPEHQQNICSFGNITDKEVPDHQKDRIKPQLSTTNNCRQLWPPLTVSAINHDRLCSHQYYKRSQQQQQQQQSLRVVRLAEDTPTPPPDPPWILDAELQFHIRHCTCSCDHLGFGNYLDFQRVDGAKSRSQRETSFSDESKNALQISVTSGVFSSDHENRRSATKIKERGENGLASSHHNQLHQQLQHNQLVMANGQHHLHYTTHQYDHPSPVTSSRPQHSSILRATQGTTTTPKHSSSTLKINANQKTLPHKLPDPSTTDHVVNSNISRNQNGDLRSLRRSTKDTLGNFGGSVTSLGRVQPYREHMISSDVFRGSGTFGPVNYYYDDYQLTPLDSCSSDGSDGSSGSDREAIVRGPWCICLVVCIVVATLAAGLGLPLALNPQQKLDATRSTPEERMIMVKRLLKDAPLIDGHNDLPWNIRKFTHNRIAHLNLSSIHNQTPWSDSQWSHTDIPRLRAGLLGAQFWSAYVPCKSQHLDAVQLTLEQIDVIRRLVELNSQHLALVETVGEIREIHKNGRIASLIGVEGGHALGNSLAVLRTFYNLGARYLTITHSCDTPWAQGVSIKPNGAPSNRNSLLTDFSIDSGLTPFGHSVIREMNRLGMIIDLSHTSISTARAILNISHAPVIFSHSSAYSLCNSSRNVPDDVLKLVAHNGGLVMVNFYTKLVTCNESASMQDVVNHINHIRAVAGVDHVGLGAGYDGINMTPSGLEDVSRYPYLLVELLADPQWSPQDIAQLAGQNLLRVFSQVEIIRDAWKRAAVQPGEDHAPPPPSSLTACRSIYNS